MGATPPKPPADKSSAIGGFFQNLGQDMKNNAFGGVFSDNFGVKQGQEDVATYEGTNPFGETITNEDGSSSYADKEGNVLSEADVKKYQDEGWEMGPDGKWVISDAKRESLLGDSIKSEKTKAVFGTIGESLLSAASSNSSYAQPQSKQVMGKIDYT